MDIKKLCVMIGMPEEVTEQMERWNAEEYGKALEQYFIRLQDKKQWDAALEESKNLLENDNNGLNLLAFQLHTGLKTYQEYIRRGIPLQIYLDTMGCFSRFVKEHYESYGTYGFDREWWTARELSLKEFRLGELEYELLGEKNSEMVSVHIPSDASLKQINCRESYKQAADFFVKYEKDYTDVPYYCESWLLSPGLKEILKETSNILSFQNDFIIDSFEPEDTGYMQWVFKKEGLLLEDVPQNTSLQTKMKTFLQKGGKIGAARGYLKTELFD